MKLLLDHIHIFQVHFLPSQKKILEGHEQWGKKILFEDTEDEEGDDKKDRE